MVQLKSENKSWCLMKYQSNSTTVTYAVIHKDNLTHELSKGRSYLTKNRFNTEQLYASENKGIATKILHALQVKIFEEMYEPQLPGQDKSTWLLVQHNNGPNIISYEIISPQDTIWNNCNSNGDLVIYLPKNNSVHQAKILKQSDNKNDLIKSLNDIQEIPCPTYLKIKKTYASIDIYEAIDVIDFEMISDNQDDIKEYYYHHDGRILDFINEISQHTDGERIDMYDGEAFYVDIEHKKILENDVLYKRIYELRRKLSNEEILISNINLCIKKLEHGLAKFERHQ